MGQAMADAAEVKAPGILCDLVQMPYCCDESVGASIVWGIRVTFLNGEVLEIPNVFTNFTEADQFRYHIQGKDIHPLSLHDIVEDYLTEIYGVWC